MYTASTNTPNGGVVSWFRSAESWLDARGRGAWLAAMVLGLVFVWPLGLALLTYMIWSKRIFKTSCRSTRADHRMGHQFDSLRPSGNAAFDAYKRDMLRRLQDEQSAFEAFMQRLREAKDKSEFDAFMQDRDHATTEAARPQAQASHSDAY